MEHKNCIFCQIIKGNSPCKKVYEDDIIIGIMDAFPFCDGHILLIPKIHYETMMELDAETLKHINEVAKNLTLKIMKNLEKHSMTLSYNYGEKQKVKHFHMHMLPNIDDEPKEEIETIYQQLLGK